MSKYDSLWKWISENCGEGKVLSFDSIQSVLGFPIDHSFLTFKKELIEYGFEVGKISMKNRTVEIRKRK